jgi:hypothetical protein
MVKCDHRKEVHHLGIRQLNLTDKEMTPMPKKNRMFADLSTPELVRVREHITGATKFASLMLKTGKINERELLAVLMNMAIAVATAMGKTKEEFLDYALAAHLGLEGKLVDADKKPSEKTKRSFMERIENSRSTKDD